MHFPITGASPGANTQNSPAAIPRWLRPVRRREKPHGPPCVR
jgi:hypothetical protein